jgi:hypothetical protein
MSKRKNRSSSPNLPQATLDRARQQLGVTPPPAEETEPVEEAVEADAEATPEVVLAAAPSPAAPSAASRPRTTRRRTEPVRAKGGRKENYDMDVIKNRLEHPTRMVTEAELRQDYSYVIKDLRSMAVLAAALIVVMIVIAQII